MTLHGRVGPNARPAPLERAAVPLTGSETGSGPADAVASRPCIFKRCPGTMQYIACAHVPGTGAIARMPDGSVRTVGTTRAAWVCDRDVHHVQVTGDSNSEVARSRS